MARLDLNEAERAELVRELRDIITNDRFPLSPRIRRLKGILEKLEPAKAATAKEHASAGPPGRARGR